MAANEQLAVWPAAAPVAVQATVVVPGRNAEPDAGVHAVWTGAVPPWVVGAGHVSVTGWFCTDTPDGAGGQVIVSCGTGGGVGAAGGSPPQPLASSDATSASIQRALSCRSGILVHLNAGASTRQRGP